METTTPSSAPLRVAGFESRRAEEMTRLLTTAGAQPFVSPSMREVGLEDNAAVLSFARGLIAGEFDVLILMTGVGFRTMLRSIEGSLDRDAFLSALARITTVARGPKPVAALKEAGINATVRIAEPNTWRDILAACREGRPDIRGSRVAIQEHGERNGDLRAGLEALGAQVTSVSVYEWLLPEDLGPLEANLRRIAAGEIDVALFTSSRQAVHVLEVARRLAIEDEVRRGLMALEIGSIGPSTTETLHHLGFDVAFEPQHPRLGHLVNAAAARAPLHRSEDRPAS